MINGSKVTIRLAAVHADPPLATTVGFAVPVATRRIWPAWVLAVVVLTAGVGAVFGGTQLLRNGSGMPLSWLSPGFPFAWRSRRPSHRGFARVPQFAGM